MVDLRGPFEPIFSELPSEIPLFPLSGALLIPGGKLPLNIFEPRYLSMVRDAISNPLRLIGMIQVQKKESGKYKNEELYSTGCAGRISNFSETEDGRILITLSGICRFRKKLLREVEEGYILGKVSWKGFESDLTYDKGEIDRDKLLLNLKTYFKFKGFTVDWNHLKNSENEKLVTTLSMICPFEVSEKQALLEAKNLSERAELLITILQMSTSTTTKTNAKH